MQQKASVEILVGDDTVIVCPSCRNPAAVKSLQEGEVQSLCRADKNGAVWYANHLYCGCDSKKTNALVYVRGDGTKVLVENNGARSAR